jgi:hypothetical protein
VKVIADLQLVRKVFFGFRVYTMYERDKHELGARLRLFRVTMLKKKVLKALRHNYLQNVAIIQKIMSNTQIIKR